MAIEADNRAPWQAQGNDKREAVRKLFADIAPTYDRLNGLMSLALHRRWRKRAVEVLGLRPGDTALDLCCGTGDFMRPLRSAVGQPGLVLGFDFCEPMLRLALPKGAGVLAMADACAIPLAAGSVHAVTVGWGIRNVADIDAVHSEIARVLRRGGRFASVDMARPRTPWMRALSREILRLSIPVLGAVFGHRQSYAYLPKSTEKFWSRQELQSSMERAGMVDVQWRDFLMGNVCLHWGTKP